MNKAKLTLDCFNQENLMKEIKGALRRSPNGLYADELVNKLDLPINSGQTARLCSRLYNRGEIDYINTHKGHRYYDKDACRFNLILERCDY